MWQRLYKSKAFWLAISAAAASIEAYMAGEIGGSDLARNCIEALAVIFIRDAVAKK